MPDALSKTVPIWCCVLNRALFPDNPDCHGLHVPPNVVSDSEKSQIEARIPDFVASFKLLGLDLPSFRAKLTKPLRPVWTVQDAAYYSVPDLESPSSHHPVVCCTSSRRVAGAELSEAGYVQGAGDDTENWALGLTAPLFWAHADDLLSAPEADLPGLIAALVAGAGAGAGAQGGGGGGARRLTPHISVCPLPIGGEAKNANANACLVSIVPAATEESEWEKSRSELEVGIGRGKLASRGLRRALPVICDFVSRFLQAEQPGGVVLVGCESGRDLSVGVALALDCRCFGDDGEVRRGDEEAPGFTKDGIRVRLGRIMTAMPEANPSRATLQSVNSFLMDWRR